MLNRAVCMHAKHTREKEEKKWCYRSSGWLEKLLRTKEHILFEIKYKNGRRIKYFESEVLKFLYKMQEHELDKNPNYNHHYIIVFEELQNAFGTYSMNDDNSLELLTVFTQSRSDAHIHYIGIGQRMNDISSKICERLRPLIGLTLGENSLRKVKAQLPKHLRRTVQQLPQRTWIYLNGKDNPIIKIPTYHKDGTVTYLKPNLQTSFKLYKPKSLWQRIKEVFTGEHQNKEPSQGEPQNEEPQDIEEKPDFPSVYNEEEDFDTELESDLGLLGEPDEEW